MKTKIFVIGVNPNVGGVRRCAKTHNETRDNRRLEELEKEVKSLKERVNDLELEQEANDKFDCESLRKPWDFNPCSEHNGEMRFGAEFAIDEPRASDYDDEDDFLDDHEAYDNFVDAGEECVARGLARPEWARAHRCNAIKTEVGDCPPCGIDLLGETDWWDEDVDCDCWWL